jgi:ATP-dependent DNA helicase PIF1
MILGGAGTGKTTFLHELQSCGGARQVFLAPTEVAALQLGGQTIHSFFGVPPRIINPDDAVPRGRRREIMRRVNRVVIDEVSMVRCDLLDVVDCCLRSVRDRAAPFGGVQVILVGFFATATRRPPCRSRAFNSNGVREPVRLRRQGAARD